MASAAPSAVMRNGSALTPLHFPHFQYQPLPTKSSIRLLSLVEYHERVGGVSFDGCPLLECVLETVDLNTNPEYDCLSYTWGHWEDKADGLYNGYQTSVKWPIIINGRLFYVLRNLHDALWQFGPFGPVLIDLATPLGKTNLISAAEHGRPQAVERLIEQGASLHLQDQSGKTALHYAAGNGDFATVRTLLKFGAPTAILDSQRRTPLDCCLQQKRGQHVEVAGLLRDNVGQTPSRRKPTTFPLRTKLWIDAICIDQTNMSERSLQVGMMSQIYSTAQTVYIWLGLASQSTRMLWEMCTQQELPEAEDFRPIGVALSELLGRRWFNRKWVIQELALARNVRIFCGAYEFDWNYIAQLVARQLRYREIPTFGERFDRGISKYIWNNPDFNCYTLVDIQAWTRSYRGFRDGSYDELVKQYACQKHRTAYKNYTVPVPSLPILLILSWNFHTTDFRDRIYSLLGIMEYAGIASGIVPDYARSISSLFTDVGKIFVEAYGMHLWYDHATSEYEYFEPLEGLSFIQGSLCGDHLFDRYHASCKWTGRDYKLPSWVPDFGERLATTRIWRKSFTAAAQSKPKIYPSKPELLRLDAYYVDRVVETDNGPIMEDPLNSSLFRFYDTYFYLKIISKLPAVSCTGEDRAESLWRTLMANDIVGDVDHARSTFKKFLCTDFAKYRPTFWKEKQYLKLLSGLAATDSSKSLPTPAEVKEFCKSYDPNASENRVIQVMDNTSFQYRFAQLVRRRGLFTTQDGRLGFGPRWLRPGDEVWLFAGARVPFILRKLSKKQGDPRYKFIGEAYVHGIMHGEVFEGQDPKFYPIEIY